MNKKTISSIASVLVLSALTTFAAKEQMKTAAPVAVVSNEDIDALPAKSIEERLAALEAANKSASWAGKVKIKGDLRYRYEYKATDGDTTTDRHRIRARVGAYGKVADNVTAAVRIASGSDESPTSTNQTLDGDFEKKKLWLDLAYITIDCPKDSGLSATFGKMKQPWISVSDLIFDTDVNPEGIASSYAFGSDDVALTATVAYHMLDDKGTGEDDNLTSGQIAAEADVAENVKLTAGAGAYYYSELDFEIIDGFVKLDIKKGPAPIKVYGEVLNNVASGVEDDAAWLAGIGTKYKKVSLDYNYRDLEANSVNGALDDGDFGGPDGKGHKVKVKYSLFKNTSIGATYFRVDRGNTDRDVLQLDLAAKF